MSDQIRFKCSICSSIDFTHPPNPSPTDEIKCSGCGAVGNLGEVQQEMERLALEYVESLLSN